MEIKQSQSSYLVPKETGNFDKHIIARLESGKLSISLGFAQEILRLLVIISHQTEVVDNLVQLVKTIGIETSRSLPVIAFWRNDQNEKFILCMKCIGNVGH